MSLSAFLVTAFIETFAPGPRMLLCTFPPADAGARPISVAVEARPSLMDRADRFRVRVHLDDAGDVGGLAQPIERTDARDVLIRTEAAGETYYTIGLRDDGLAALNLLRAHGDAVTPTQETRRGACRDFKGVLDTWLRH